MTLGTYTQDIFDLEIQAWCYGLKNYPGEIYTDLVLAVIDEVTPCFIEALKSNLQFSVVDIANKFVEASHYVVDHYTITKLICQKLPNPNELTDNANDMDELYLIANILSEIEEHYVGFHAVMEDYWSQAPADESVA
ncbi:MAG: hypothetical protein ACOX3T_04775 [Bdellovibrionota bacterium]|jgi:hypothetical protein